MTAPTEPTNMLDRIRQRAAAGDEDAQRILAAVEERDEAEAKAKAEAEAGTKRAGAKSGVEDKMAGAGL